MHSVTGVPTGGGGEYIIGYVIFLVVALGLFFIDAKYKMYLWEGWWPVNAACDSPQSPSAASPNTAAEKHRFNMNRKLAMQSIKAYAEGMGYTCVKLLITLLIKPLVVVTIIQELELKTHTKI